MKEINFKNFLKKKPSCQICNLSEISVGILHSMFVDKIDIDSIIEKYGVDFYNATNLKIEKKMIENHINKHVMINELRVAISNANKEELTFLKPIVVSEMNTEITVVAPENKTFIQVIKSLDTVDEKVKYSTKFLEEKINKIIEQDDEQFKHIADKVALNKIQCETIANYIKSLREGQLHDLKVSKLSNIDRELELKSIFMALKQCFVLALSDIPLSEELKQKFNNVFQLKVAENFKDLKIEFFNELMKDRKQRFF
jgi:hypothetical protein